MRKRSLRGVNEHFDPIFNAVLPSAGTFQTSPRATEGKRDGRPAAHPLTTTRWQALERTENSVDKYDQTHNGWPSRSAGAQSLSPVVYRVQAFRFRMRRSWLSPWVHWMQACCDGSIVANGFR
ncbi:hypothetical protein EBB56_07425 [Halomonas sp. YLB-10]|nr:hypothetical protein EBB56_07425 [Halomonas sp. YLB-10]